MGRVVRTRILLCGLLSGGVWTVLSAILMALVGAPALATVTEGRPITPGVHVFLFLSNIAAGIWAMWLYAAIRPRYRAGPKTAVFVGLAWWIIASLQSAKWVALLSVPMAEVLPLSINVVAAVAAAVVGAWAYRDEKEPGVWREF